MREGARSLARKKSQGDDDLDRGQRARLQLLESAADLFAEQGDVSVRAIAEHAGINHGLVHYYFGSKAKLRSAAYEYVSTTITDQTALSAQLSAEEVFRRAWQALQQDSRAMRILVRSLLDDDHELLHEVDEFPFIQQVHGLVLDDQKEEGAALLSQGAAALIGWFFLRPWFERALDLDEAAQGRVTERIIEHAGSLLAPLLGGQARTTPGGKAPAVLQALPGSSHPRSEGRGGGEERGALEEARGPPEREVTDLDATRKLAQSEALERLDPERAIELARSVLEQPADDRAATRKTRAWAHVRLGRALMMRGKLQEAWDSAGRAAALARELRDQELQAEADKLVAALFFRFGHLEAALEANDRAAAAAAEVPQAHELRLSILSDRASMLRRGGRLHDAAEAFAKLLPRARRQGSPPLVAKLRLNQASTLWQVDDLAGAREALAEAAALIEAHDLQGLQGWRWALQAWVSAAAGQLADARAEARQALASPGEEAARASAVRILARSTTKDPEASADDLDAAFTELAALAEQAQQEERNGDLPEILQDLADLEERRGHAREAVRHLRASIAAQEALDEANRELRLEAEQLRMELVRLTVYAEQLRLRTEELAAAKMPTS